MGGQQPNVSEENPSPRSIRAADGAASLGFGCAGLYALPSKRDRRRVLDAAYDLGIRHFDCAAIYGLGLAEAELGEFVQGRSDVVIATKFGMRPTFIGRVAGRAQAPVRRRLQSSPALQARLRASGAKKDGAKKDTPNLNKILYTHREYSVVAAERQLAASVRNLHVDQLAYFLLHEPAGSVGSDYAHLAEWLCRAQDRGMIGQWGPAGDLSRMDANLVELSERATVHQFPYDLVRGYRGPIPESRRTSITFGFIAAALPHVQNLLVRKPALRQRCSELLDAELSDRQVLARLLVRDALARNPFGTVLVSSSKITNLKMLCAAADTPFRNQAEVSDMIRQEFLREVIS